MLREGNSFYVAVERQITIPDDPSILTFEYEGTFDVTDPSFINDAFEVALPDENDVTIVPSFLYQRDAFFNITEDELPVAGVDTTHFPEQTGVTVSGTVDLDISALAAGAAATIVLRLVNNDSDTATEFRLIGEHVPVAVDDVYATNEDTVLNVPPDGVLANDTDEDGDPLFVTSYTQPMHGTVTVNNDGSFTYTPDANFHGSDSFTYQASDGAFDSNSATVDITVNPVNDAPVASDDAYSTSEDTPLTIAADGVLGNDSDVDGDSLTASLVSGPSDGTLVLNADGSFTYTPDENFFGTDSFTYRASDGQLDSNVATVTVTVDPVNDPPVAVDDDYTVAEDQTLNVAAAGCQPFHKSCRLAA